MGGGGGGCFDHFPSSTIGFQLIPYLLSSQFIHYPTFLVGGKNLTSDCQPKQLANKINPKQLTLLNSSSRFEIRQYFQLFMLAYLEGGDDKARVAASFAFRSADSCASEEERNLRSSCTLLSN